MSDQYAFEFSSLDVPRSLAPYVLKIEGYAERETAPISRTELPSCSVPLILVIEDAFVVHDSAGGANRSLDTAFVAGLHKRPVRVDSAGRAAAIQVDLTPLGARRLLRIDMDQLTGRVVDLEDLLARKTVRLMADLRQVDQWTTRLRIVRQFLEQHLLTQGHDDPRLHLACQLVHGGRGIVRVESLATRLDMSRKHLNQLFKAHIGLSPRDYIRTERFTRVMRELTAQHGQGDRSLADLALSCGYADQSHFNRDFKTFSGATPRALCRRLLPDGQGILDASHVR